MKRQGEPLHGGSPYVWFSLMFEIKASAKMA
jgi:hypothetical protein